MELSDEEWQDRLRGLRELQKEIEAWPSSDPDPTALRCEFSRHRTLAHLRAAQETWLQAVLLFAQRENASLNLPHPWRLFESRRYDVMPWSEHREHFLADRATWLALVTRADVDRNRGGRLSRKSCTIASLTDHLISHERHHLSILRLK